MVGWWSWETVLRSSTCLSIIRRRGNLEWRPSRAKHGSIPYRIFWYPNFYFNLLTGDRMHIPRTFTVNLRLLTHSTDWVKRDWDKLLKSEWPIPHPTHPVQYLRSYEHDSVNERSHKDVTDFSIGFHHAHILTQLAHRELAIDRARRAGNYRNWRLGFQTGNRWGLVWTYSTQRNISFMLCNVNSQHCLRLGLICHGVCNDEVGVIIVS